jgi:hypothetical protein
MPLCREPQIRCNRLRETESRIPRYEAVTIYTELRQERRFFRRISELSYTRSYAAATPWCKRIRLSQTVESSMDGQKSFRHSCFD